MGHEPASYWHATTGTPATFALQAPTTVDVAVVGGGILGAATTYWLARAGVKTVLVERTALAHGATGRNGGFVTVGTAEAYPAAIARVGHATARAVYQLTLANRSLLRQVLAEEDIACDYREPGHLSLALGSDQLSGLAQTVAGLQADGFATTLLDRSQTQAMIGTPLGPDITGSVFTPETGLVHPARLVHGLIGAARRYGAQSLHATVARVVPDGAGVAIHTDAGILRAGAAVIAVNAWTGDLIPSLAGLVVPVRGQMLAYAPIPPVFRTGMGAAVTATGEYWQQTVDGTILLGGCRAAAPDRDVAVRESQPTGEVQRALEQIVPRLFPALSRLQVAQRWAGLMAFTPDYLPIAGRVSGSIPIWVVGGFCGHGMPFGMRLGQLLAEAATHNVTPAPLAILGLSRDTLVAHVPGDTSP